MAAPSTGVNTLTGEGLAEVLKGASVVVEFIGRGLRARNDSREVVVDPNTPYFGAKLRELALIASGEASIGEMRFDSWLSAATTPR